MGDGLNFAMYEQTLIDVTWCLVHFKTEKTQMNYQSCLTFAIALSA